SPHGFFGFGGKTFFVANGTNMFRTDGTAAGTSPVMTKVHSYYGDYFTQVQDPQFVTTVGSKMYFTANDPASGGYGYTSRALFVSDGTDAGTKIVTDTIQVTSERLVFDSAGSHYETSTAPQDTHFNTPQYLALVNGVLYFA